MSLNESYAGSIVLFTEDDLRAKEVYSSLKKLGLNNIYYYPTSEISFYNIRAIEDDREIERVCVQNKLLNNEKIIIVTSINSSFKKYRLQTILNLLEKL